MKKPTEPRAALRKRRKQLVAELKALQKESRSVEVELRRLEHQLKPT